VLHADDWQQHPAGDWQEGAGFDGDGTDTSHDDFDYRESNPAFGPPPHEDERHFPPWQRQSGPGADAYPDESEPGPEMERFGRPGPGVERLGPPPQAGGHPGLPPSLMDIKLVPPAPDFSLKRGPEHLDGDLPSSHQFGAPPEKVPPKLGPGNDMWPEENLPPPPPVGPGRGVSLFRGGPGRGRPRGRGMRGVRGR